MIVYSPSRFYTPETEEDRGKVFHPIVMRALKARGITTEEAVRRFMYPDISQLRDPFALPDMDRAVERIERAVEDGENICIYGDYDVDGICATTILLHYLLSIGAFVTYRIPSRWDEGYGISRKAVDSMKASGVDLIITVDNGISASNEIGYANSLGIDVIVTDHHIPPDELPDCCAVVCHTVAGDSYPHYLCGAGTALKLVQALGGVEAAKDYIFLAGVATVADVVPLLDENRFLVKYALEALNKGECCLGMRMLVDSLTFSKKPCNVYSISYGIAPKLNASGRMGDASLGVELFMTEDPREAERIINELNRMNELRQAEEQAILDDAMRMVEELDISDKHAIVLASDRWNHGVTGVAASRLAEMYNRPTILFSDFQGKYKGSTRSIEGINIHEALKANSELFLRFGGHAKAAGLTMEKDMFPECVRAMEKYFAENCAPELFVPRKCYEFDEDLSNISMELVKQLEMLAPFGEGNPCPVFHVSNISPSHIRRFGSEGQHLKMDVRRNRFSFESVYFCGGSNFDTIMRADSVSMLYSPSINSWNGTELLQLRVLSVRPDLPKNPGTFVNHMMPSFCEAFLKGVGLAQGTDADVELFTGSPAELIRSSFAGLIVLAFSTDGAEKVLRELAHAKVENFEVCIGTVTEGMFSSNALVLAPDVNCLPTKGYNRVLFVDEPYSEGAYSEVKKLLPEARLMKTGESSDFSDIVSGFSIGRDELANSYRLAKKLVSSRKYSMPELAGAMCEAMHRPRHQVLFALEVFRELGFFSDDGGRAVRALDTERRSLEESALYSKAAFIQHGCCSK